MYHANYEITVNIFIVGNL